MDIFVILLNDLRHCLRETPLTMGGGLKNQEKFPPGISQDIDRSSSFRINLKGRLICQALKQPTSDVNH